MVDASERIVVPMTRLVGVYVRLSKHDVEQASIGRQERLCRQIAEARGWPVVAVYVDEDRSAYRAGVTREGYERLLGDAVGRRFDSILVWRLDRLVRSPAEFERLWSTCRANGVALVSATEPVDSTDPVGVAVIRLLVTFAGLESDVKSIRLKAKNREIAEAGLPPSGPRRFGHTAGFTGLVEHEATLIREAASQVLEGESTAAIIRDWAARGVVGIAGRPWSPSGLRSMLRSRRLVGERTYRGEVVANRCWPAILDEVTAAQVRNCLAGRPGGAQRRPSPSLLQGRVRCGLCGTPMHSRGRRDTPCYVCPPPRGCGRVSIDRPALDEWAKATVLARLAGRSPDNHRTAVDRRGADEAVRALDAQAGRLEELNRRYYVTAEITYPEWVRARDDLLAVTEKALTTIIPPGFPPGRPLADAAQVWDELTSTAQRGVIGTELAWVTIAPAPARNGVWYPARIHPRWHRPAPAHIETQMSEVPRRLNHDRRVAQELSNAEAAAYLGMGPTVLNRLVTEGHLDAVERNGRRRFTVPAVRSCIERCRIQPSTAPSSASIGSG